MAGLFGHPVKFRKDGFPSTHVVVHFNPQFGVTARYKIPRFSESATKIYFFLQNGVSWVCMGTKPNGVSEGQWMAFVRDAKAGMTVKALAHVYQRPERTIRNWRERAGIKDSPKEVKE